jgi:hypothetical protein
VRRQSDRQRHIQALLGLAWIVLIAVGALTPLAAQTLVGQISGTVTDPSKAVLPGVTVTVVNDETQVSRSVVTDDRGAYIITNLPPGNYTVTAELQGFKKSGRTGFTLNADGRLTADFTMTVGDVTESVEVAAVAGEAVNRTSGEIARVIDSKQVQSLALNARNYLQLATLVPGSAQTDFNVLATTTSLGTGGQSINGNRGATNNLSVDGVFNLVSGSNASQINNVGIDFIDEVKMQTSNFSAEYGRNSGASINVVTKSGTNAFHGSLFEYLRNDKLDAKDFFAARKPKLRFNDYGGSVGGPIQKSKLFFFGGLEYKKIRQELLSRTTLPTTAMLNGDFSAVSTALRFPGTTNTIPGNNISALMTPDGKAIANLYRAMQQRATGFTDTPTANNTVFQEQNPFDWREVFARVDYRISDKQNIYYRFIYDSYDLIDPYGTFINSNMPTSPSNRIRPAPNHQISYTWFVTPTFISESKASMAYAAQRIPPVGDLWKRDTYGFAFPQIYPSGGRFENSIPDGNVTGFANWRGEAQALLSPTTDINATETVTWLRGSHTIKGGVSIVRSRIDQNGRSTYAGNLSFSTTGNSNTTGNAMADALLGNFRTYSEANGDPVGFFRFWQNDGFVTDNWRIGNKLSVDVGVRVTWEQPMYTQANNVANFDPSLYNPAQAVRMNKDGTIVPNSGNRYNGLIRAGDGVPDADKGRVPGVDSPAVAAVPTGAPRGFYDSAWGAMPRVGFAWTPTDSGKTSVRGGFGVFYDRPEGNIYFSQVNNPPFLQSVQYDNGNLGNPSAGTPSTNAPFATVAAIDPGLVAPRTYQFSVGVQRELAHGYFVEASYVGNRGRHLIYYPDINQVPFDVAAANAALPAADRFTTNALRPYTGYSVIQQRRSDAILNYNAMQLYATKRQGDLTFTASYTLSKALTNASGIGDNPEDPFNINFAYGPASFDRRHVAVFTYTYALPFFRDRGGILGNTLGGWEVSGITRFQSGQYFTVTADTLIGNRRADFIGDTPKLAEGDRTPAKWFNTLAFVAAPDNRRGNATVGQIQGPGYKNFDISVRKRFLVTKAVNALFVADFFNAFNIVNYTGLTVNMANAGFGGITTSAPARNIQLGLKFTF